MCSIKQWQGKKIVHSSVSCSLNADKLSEQINHLNITTHTVVALLKILNEGINTETLTIPHAHKHIQYIHYVHI